MATGAYAARRFQPAQLCLGLCESLPAGGLIVVLVRIGATGLDRLRRHLLRTPRCEQGAFLFCRHSVPAGDDEVFDCEDWSALKRSDYEVQAGDYLELTDAARACLIKQAHDRSLCLVESHSHPGPYPAAFSYSDLSGLDEFVPHVRWRLRGRPYAALVFAQSGFDGLAWTDRAGRLPQQVAAIETERGRLAASGLTLAPSARAALG